MGFTARTSLLPLLAAALLLGSGADNPVDVHELNIGITARGLPIKVTRVGSGDADSKPGILVVGGVDARQRFTIGLADNMIEQLAASGEQDPAALANVTYYILPIPSPDALLEHSIAPSFESATNATPYDDDRDGAIDEDGPEDLNGDGLITMMRVTDPAGMYIPHPLDPRVLIPVKPENGEAGQYSLYIEGRDNDQDERWNEDPPGGVDFNRNFPFDYPYFQPGAGDFACCENESKALADFMWDHHNIAAVVTLGGDDNLHLLWPSGQHDGAIITSPPAGDAPYFEKVAAKYKELSPRDGAPQPTDQRGSLLKWSYLQYGRWAFGVQPWWPLAPKPATAEPADVGAAPAQPSSTDPTPQVQASSGEAPAGAAPVPKWDEKDKRGAAELEALKWIDANGVDAFVPWTAVADDEFHGRQVEVGGFKPCGVAPPAAEQQSLATQQTHFVQAVASMLPSIEFDNGWMEYIGGGVYRIRLTLVNKGVLPTMPEMGEITHVPYPLQITITLPKDASIVAGRQRERLPRITGGGGSIERTWLVRMPSGGDFEVTAQSPSVGKAVKTVHVFGGAP